MGRDYAKYYIVIGCIVIGTLVSSNIDTKNNYNYKILNAFQLKEAMDESYKLKKDITDLSSKYSKYKLQLEKYDETHTQANEIIQDIKKELDFNDMVLGKTEVEGPGIKITLKDATDEYLQSYDIYNLIHDQDMIQVINDVKNSGAEEIEINGIRLIDRTEIYCNGVFLRINGVKIPAPFTISAIGNGDAMKQYLLSPENYLSYLQVRGIYVSIEDEDNIKIPAFQGDIDSEYLVNPAAKK